MSHFFDSKMTWKIFCQKKKAVKRTATSTLMMKTSRRGLWKDATSHNIRKNCHPSKSSGLLVHFHRTLVNTCLADNEW